MAGWAAKHPSCTWSPAQLVKDLSLEPSEGPRIPPVIKLEGHLDEAGVTSTQMGKLLASLHLSALTIDVSCTEEAFGNMCESLKDSRALKRLCLHIPETDGWNPSWRFQYDLWLRLTQMLAESSIEKVDLSLNGLTDEFVDIMAKGFMSLAPSDNDRNGGDRDNVSKSKPFALKELKLSQNAILGTTSGFKDLLGGIPGLNIEKLTLNSNRVESISSILTDNSLVWLDLRDCHLSESALQDLASWLGSDSCCLEKLSLSYNGVFDDGAIALSRGFPTNDSLQILEIEQCGITEAGGVALAQSLKRNRSIQEVFCGGNELRDSIQELVNAMAYNRDLTILAQDPRGENYSDDMYRRLTSAQRLDYPVREYLDVCMEAWNSWTGDAALQPREFSFWSDTGFSKQAATFIGTELSQFKIMDLVCCFDGEVLDALLRSGADTMLTTEFIQDLNSTSKSSLVVKKICESDLVPTSSLKSICRRAIRKKLGPTLVDQLLCGEHKIQWDIRKFLFYNADLEVGP